MTEVYIELQKISCNPSCLCIFCLFASNQSMCNVIGLVNLCRAFLFKTKTLNKSKNKWPNCAKHNETDWQDTTTDHFKGKDFTVRLKITPQLSRMLLPLMGSQLIDVMIDSSVHLWSCYNDHRDSKPMKCFLKLLILLNSWLYNVWWLSACSRVANWPCSVKRVETCLIVFNRFLFTSQLASCN